MKELSLNILDIAQNSIKAGAKLVKITLTETEELFTFEITDDGCGMTRDFLANVTDPFTTTRTTRKVGLGLPLLKMEAEMTGGHFEIESKSEKEFSDHGTRVLATFCKTSIDFIPLGDIIGTMCVLIQGAENVDFEFSHTLPEGTVTLSTAELRTVLGEDVPLSSPEVIEWVRGYLEESYQSPETA